MRTAAAIACTLFLGALLASPAPEDSNLKEISFVAEADKTTQQYMLILPPDFRPDQPHDLLIALHGHGSDRRQFATQARSECKAARDAAARHGMIFVSPDYRGTASWMSPKAEADVAQIIGDLKRQYRVGKVIVTGGSMGGVACLAFAARRPELVDGVASMNGCANLLEYSVEPFVTAIARSYGGTKAEIPQVWKDRSAEYWPERLTMPVAMTAGGKDTAVPPESVVRLAGILKQLNRAVLLIYRETGGHSTSYEDATAILEFVITKAKDPAGASSKPAGATSKPASRPAGK